MKTKHSDFVQFAGSIFRQQAEALEALANGDLIAAKNALEYMSVILDDECAGMAKDTHNKRERAENCAREIVANDVPGSAVSVMTHADTRQLFESASNTVFSYLR